MAKERYDIGSDVDMCSNTLYNAKIDGASCVVPKDSNSHTHDNRDALDKVSGENTGDEDKASIVQKLDITSEDVVGDSDELLADRGGNFIKVAFSKVKALLKAFFDNEYSDRSHNHNLNDLAEKSYNSLDDLPILDFEPANENIQSHIGDGAIHVTSLQKEDFHAHTNKTALDAVKGVNTGDQSSSDFDIKDLSDTTSLRSTWSGKQDALTFSTDIETDKASTTKISAIKTFYDWATGLFATITNLNTKADISPANGSTSALRALYIARSWNRAAGGGAERYELTYNSATGYYEMYGINDLTEADVAEIYISSMPFLSTASTPGVATFEGVLAYRNCRTNFPLNYFSQFYQCTIRYLAQENKKIEKFIHGGFYGGMRPANIANAFNGCIKLNEVSVLDLQHITTTPVVDNAFLNCAALITAPIKNLKVDFSFAWSPLLSLASLQYLVTNRLNGTTRITITVHADVWAKLNDATNYPTWNALLVDAVNNQYIDFASAES